MNRFARLLAVPAVLAALAGCGESKPAPVPTDAESIKRLEEEQKRSSQGEGGSDGPSDGGAKPPVAIDP